MISDSCACRYARTPLESEPDTIDETESLSSINVIAQAASRVRFIDVLQIYGEKVRLKDIIKQKNSEVRSQKPGARRQKLSRIRAIQFSL
jgi:hypothetical protein